MKITQSSINMEGRSENIRTHSVTESLRKWNNGTETTQSNPLPGSIRMALSAAGFDKMKADLAKQNKDVLASATAGTAPTEVGQSAVNLTDKDMAKLKMIEDFVYVLTGKRIKIVVPENPLSKVDANTLQQANAQQGEGPKRLGWGVDYQYHEQTYEKEAASFSTSGSVETADGRKIDFNLQFSMSREFLSETNISLKAGDAMVDPLTLNFSAATATLGERSFKFDLDTDGTQENISFAGPGSGFLALDKDNSGTIENGSELFGPQSGNGFTELAAYDGDKNGWIDENDAIFDKLRIWSMDSEGGMKLEALGQKGVGAIYLGNVTTPFRLMGADGQTNGQISRSGVYLREDGSAGTIQHVDLTV